MFNNIHFYNHYGNGDLFISTEFVKAMRDIIPAQNYYYAHAKNKRFFSDIPWLQWEPIIDNHKMRSYYEVIDNDLFINTWLGVTSKYVTPANSCTIENSFKMYSQMLRDLGLEKFKGGIINYVPQPDYKFYQEVGVDQFILEYGKDFIILDTVNVQSNQAINFDFTNIVDMLGKELPNYNFVTTTRFDTPLKNIIYSGDITRTTDGFDLYEISYLSRFTKLIIGRSSGPAVFCMTRENTIDVNKIFLSFTNREEAAHILETPAGSRVYWSNANKDADVYKIISEVIKRL